jgi:hypothetical protein
MKDLLNFKKTLSIEVGQDLSEIFSDGLFIKTNHNISKGINFFYNLGQSWGPLIQNWALWINKKALHKNIALILRDTKPLEVLNITDTWHRLYLNRQNCGIADEISGDNTEMNPLLKEYLKQNNCANEFTFIDSGCYGSIVLELHKIGISFQPLFFFSKNPNIPGYLNELGVDEEIGTILNDSLECAFPNIFNRPNEFINHNGQIKAKLVYSDKLSVNFGKAALNGVKKSKLISEHESLNVLLDLLDKSQKGDFTGIFNKPSPEWSQKQNFLDNWPKNLNWNKK